MNRGHIHLWRKITDSDLWPKGRRFTPFEAWIDMLLLARGVDNEELKRGQFEASLGFLSKRWKWDRSTVSRFLKKQAKKGRIVVQHQAQHQAQQVTICKYEVYHGGPQHQAQHQAQPIKERLKKEKEECSKEHLSSVSSKALLEIYQEENQLLPQVKAFSEGRKSKCRSRINRALKQGRLEPYLQDFREAVRQAQRIPFLCGQSSKGDWKASFDWFIANEDNIYKVLEGKYGEPQGQKGGDDWLSKY